MAEVRGQSGQNGLPRFESPWLGYDTGSFAEGFDPGGFGPAAVAAGDLDGDGDPDLIVGNWSSPRPGLSVLLNVGDGTYGWPAFYTLPDGKSVADVALSDVDADGDLDALATVPDFNGSSNILALWRNNGDGTFASHVEFATGPGPKGLALADFNGDGFTDVATANHGYVSRANNTVSVILHNGLKGAAAGFLSPVDFAVSGMEVERVEAADVNGDGRPDLALGGKNLAAEPGKVVVSGGRLAVLFNDGAGRFNLSATYISYPDSRLVSAAVALADLDKDGDADLIGGGMVTNGTDDKGLISVRRNAGNGTFGPPEAYLFASNVNVPSSFALGDLNRDGFTDVVATTPSGRTMDGWVALLSNGAGGFLPAARYEASQETRDVVLADANHDSFIDVLTVATSSAAVTVHRNSGVGTFAVLPRNLVGLESNGLIGNVFAALEAGDLDRDGDIDIVTNDEKAYILKNNGKGKFAPAVSYTPPINAAEVKLRDLNGDGSLDLLFGPDRNAAPYHFASALNNGDGTFAPGTITNVNACQAGSIDAFDLDGDGDLDVVLTEEGSCRGGPGFRIFIFRNDGRANFTLATTLKPPCGPSGIGGGDLNGDGRLDLVTRGCAGVAVFPGNGDLTFGPQLESGAAPYKFKLADLNGDGRLDLAMILTNVPASTTVVGTLLGNGDGTFAPPRTQSGSSVGEALVISSDIDVADADGDGDADLFVTNDASNDLSLFLNNGDGSVRRHERYGVGNMPTFSALADFDGDGAVDVASDIGLPQYGTKSAVVVLRNTRLDVIIGVPNAVITSPADGSVYDAPATIHVTAEVYPVPGRAITKVEFYLGDGKGGPQKLVYTDTAAPYAFDLTNQGGGTYSLYAYAYDSEDVGISPGIRYTVNGAARHNISGHLTDQNGQPIVEALINLQGTFSDTYLTDAQGSYTINGLAAGGSFTVTPSKAGYTFTPAQHAFTNLSADQTADFSAVATGTPVNHALASNGGVATASSSYSSNYPAASVNNGDRRGLGWNSGGGWNDATSGAYPDWVEVAFGGQRSVGEVDVFTLQDSPASPSEPTEAQTFAQYGVTGFEVQYWDGAAWAIVPGGSVTGNDRVWRKLTFSPVTTSKIRIVITGALAGYSRVVEVEAWGLAAGSPTPTPAPAGRTNVALSSNGGAVTASSAYNINYPATSLNNGDRRGLGWNSGGGWNDATADSYPDWVEVAFAGEKIVDEIDVFTLQDSPASPSEPTEAQTFTKYGVTGMRVEYWTGSAWAVVPGGLVVSTDRVWNKITFPAVSTTKMRVVVTGALASYSRLVEVEVWQPAAAQNMINHALASNGGVATASSSYSSNYPAASVNNGDRRGLGWNSGGGWNDATSGAYPDWVEVAFSGDKSLTEVDVFTLQDSPASPSEPTEAMTFTKYGVTGMRVEYWTGSAWAEVPGASASGNDKVWRKFFFPVITTSKLRVVVTGALASYSRIVEVEAY